MHTTFQRMFLASGNREELGFYSVLIWLVVSELSYTSAWSERTGLTVEVERTPAVHKRYDLSMYLYMNQSIQA